MIASARVATSVGASLRTRLVTRVSMRQQQTNQLQVLQAHRRGRNSHHLYMAFHIMIYTKHINTLHIHKIYPKVYKYTKDVQNTRRRRARPVRQWAPPGRAGPAATWYFVYILYMFRGLRVHALAETLGLRAQIQTGA